MELLSPIRVQNLRGPHGRNNGEGSIPELQSQGAVGIFGIGLFDELHTQ